MKQQKELAPNNRQETPEQSVLDTATAELYDILVAQFNDKLKQPWPNKMTVYPPLQRESATRYYDYRYLERDIRAVVENGQITYWRETIGGSSCETRFDRRQGLCVGNVEFTNKTEGTTLKFSKDSATATQTVVMDVAGQKNQPLMIGAVYLADQEQPTKEYKSSDRFPISVAQVTLPNSWSDETESKHVPHIIGQQQHQITLAEGCQRVSVGFPSDLPSFINIIRTAQTPNPEDILGSISCVSYSKK